MSNIDEELAELGTAFRQLTLHSDGTWSAKVGKQYAKEKGLTKFMVKAPTALEALIKLRDKLSEERKV